jgi:hypothetical protein
MEKHQNIEHLQVVVLRLVHLLSIMIMIVMYELLSLQTIGLRRLLPEFG